jgi:phage tail tube protein FII
VEKIVNDAIKANPSLTAEDVQKIVSDAVKTVPNLTAEQVKNIVGAEVSKLPVGASPSDVQKAVDAAKTELTKAVEKVAAGAASGNADLQKSIDALKAAGLTAADVQKAVDASAANQSAATKQAIEDATRGLATGTALEKAQGDLSKEIQAARDIGLKGDAALQAGLDSMAAKMGVSQAEVLKQLGTTAAELKDQFAADIAKSQTATEKSIADTKAALGDAIAKAKAAGLEGDAALQAGIDSVAAKMGVNQAEVLKQLGTSTDALRGEFSMGLAGVSAESRAQYNALNAAQKAEADARVAQGQNLQDAITGVTGQVTGLEGQLTAQGKDFANQLVRQGMDYNTALKTAIDAQSAMFGTQIGDVQSQLAANEAQRQADLAAQRGREEAAKQAEAERQRLAAAEAVRQGKIADVRGTLARGQQTVQSVAQQLPQALQQAQQVTTPLYGAMEYFDPFGDPFGDPFATQKLKMASSTNPAEKPKMASGGYIDDLLAEDLSVDDLMNLLR